MKFFLFPMIDEAQWAGLPPDEMQKRMATYGVFAGELKASGAFVNAFRPQPSAQAKTVRVNAAGQVQVDAGPNTPSPEQLAGVYIIDVADMDAALAWAARCPAAQYGLVEVRPI